jgi:hypothetical protein
MKYTLMYLLFNKFCHYFKSVYLLYLEIINLPLIYTLIFLFETFVYHQDYVQYEIIPFSLNPKAILLYSRAMSAPPLLAKI